MGFFSWCTSDTRKSIANCYADSSLINSLGRDKECVIMPGEKVYLLNPFGKPYEEDCYDGYGRFGGEDVYALVAKWNVPDRCKDANGNWLPDDEIRNIGIDLACYYEDHVKLKYPIKIVEKPVPYEEAEISAGCPLQGYFYDEAIDGRSLKSRIDYEFKRLHDAKKSYEEKMNYLNQSKKFDDIYRTTIVQEYDIQAYDTAEIQAKNMLQKYIDGINDKAFAGDRDALVECIENVKEHLFSLAVAVMEDNADRIVWLEDKIIRDTFYLSDGKIDISSCKSFKENDSNEICTEEDEDDIEL